MQTEKFTIPALGYYTVPLHGNFFHVVDSSGPIDVEPAGQPKVIDVRGGARKGYGNEKFPRLRLRNKHATQTVTGTISVGDGDGSDSSDMQPQVSPTVNDGLAALNLANGASTIISGVDSSGNRRKHFTVTMRAALGGNILVYNNRTGLLILIVCASTGGGGIREETDDDILILNNTGGAIVNNGAAPDFAISQVFYKNAV